MEVQGMHKKRDTEIAMLNASIRLATAVLRECQASRMPHDTNVWVFGLLAKLVASARSARMLIEAHQYWDAKLIIRSMYDAVIDMYYILHDPALTRQILRLLQMETVVDKFEQLKRHARSHNTTVDRLPDDPFTRSIRKAYSKVTVDPAFSAGKNNWPKRWIHIGR